MFKSVTQSQANIDVYSLISAEVMEIEWRLSFPKILILLLKAPQNKIYLNVVELYAIIL